MKKFVTIVLVIFITSCDSPPEKPFYVPPSKPEFIADAEDKEKN